MGRKFSNIVPQGIHAIGRWLAAAEMHTLDSNPVRIITVELDKLNKYGARWVLGLMDLRTAEALRVGLKCNPYRDAQMASVAEALDNGEVIDPVILVPREKDGAYVVTDAPDDMLDALAAETGKSVAELMDQEPWADSDEDADTTVPEGNAPAPAPKPMQGERLSKARARG